MKLLIIEDEEDLLRALKKGFKQKGYVVDGTTNGADGYELLTINEYDLVVLDLNLPGMSGLDILKELRKENSMQKVLVLSARSSFSERIEGLDLGANDYLIKPFDFGELEARVRSLLRRNFIQNNCVLEFDSFFLDTTSRSLFAHTHERISLTSREYSILEYLLLNRKRVVSAEELIEHLWHEDADLFSKSIKVHISAIRKKLAVYSDKELIGNQRGTGYFMAEARAVEESKGKRFIGGSK